MTMKEYVVSRVLNDEETRALRGQFLTDISHLTPIPGDEPFRMKDEYGNLIAVMLPTPTDTARFRRLIRQCRWGTTIRSGSGISNRSVTFGFSPRLSMRLREGCGATVLVSEQPEIFSMLCDTATNLASWLDEHHPEIGGPIRDTPILDDWRIGQSGWTSGVINFNSELPYHFDAANFNVWSAMPAVRRGVVGGDLAIPEYGMILPVRDSHTLLFNGSEVLHSVTPMRKTSEDAYRITTVYYCLKGMRNCADFATETHLAQQRRSDLERRIERTQLVVDPDKTEGRTRQMKVMRRKQEEDRSPRVHDDGE
jgi:hypothetical protein